MVTRLAPRAFGEASASGDVVLCWNCRARQARGEKWRPSANIGGLEFLFGIPEGIGGRAIFFSTNGGETKDVLIEATGVARDGSKHVLSERRHEFSLTQQRRRPLPSSSPPRAFAGEIRDTDTIRARDGRRCRPTARPRSRSAKRPAARPSRTPPAIPPGSWWILHHGGAWVSEMHCNFLINTGDEWGRKASSAGRKRGPPSKGKHRN